MKCPQKCTVSHLNVYIWNMTFKPVIQNRWSTNSNFLRISHQEWTQRSTTCCQLIEPPSTPSSSSLTLRSRWRRTPWSTWSAPWLTMLALSIRCPVSDMMVLVMMMVVLVIVKSINIPGNPWRGIPKGCDCELRKYFPSFRWLDILYSFAHEHHLISMLFNAHIKLFILINVQSLRLQLKWVISSILDLI